MAITIDTVANVKVLPDLSAFAQAEPADVAESIRKLAGTRIDDYEIELIAGMLLEHFWIVPRQ